MSSIRNVLSSSIGRWLSDCAGRRLQRTQTNNRKHRGCGFSGASPSGCEIVAAATETLESRQLLTLLISEIQFNPVSSAPNVFNDQYVELRGEPGSFIAAGTYLLSVDGHYTNSRGEVDEIFDLSGLSVGDNGFLVLLQAGNSFETHTDANVLTSTSNGFNGLPGGILSGSVFGSISGFSKSFFLVESSVVPVHGDDIDTNDDGIPDPIGVFSSWTVLDSVGMLTGTTGDLAYADLVFRELNLIDDNHPGTAPAASTIVDVGTSISWLGRIGSSSGSLADDWMSAGTSVVSEDPALYHVRWGLSNDPTHYRFASRELDHIGAPNFLASASGSVFNDLNGDGDRDSGEPGIAGVTIFADANANGVFDATTVHAEPDQFDDGTELTNAIPGVTLLMDSGDDGLSGFEVTSVEDTDTSTGDFVFGHAGIGFFLTRLRLRMEFLAPVSSVSLDAVSQQNVIDYASILEVYDADGVLLESFTSDMIEPDAFQPMSITRPTADIAYAIAYPDDGDDDPKSSPFGGFDNLRFTQAEYSTVTGSNGDYLLHLPPDGEFVLQQQSVTNFVPTSPAGDGGHAVTFHGTENQSELDFGSHDSGVDLEVTSNSPPTAVAGGNQVSQTFTVRNTGPATATGVSLRATPSLPAGVSVLSEVTDGDATFDPETGVWNVGTVAGNGGSVNLIVIYTVDASAAHGAKIDYNMDVLSVDGLQRRVDNDLTATSTSIERRFDLSVNIAESTDIVTQGSGTGNLTYIITVTNHGPSLATGVRVGQVLTMPAGVTLDSTSTLGGSSSFSNSVWTVGTLGVGDSQTLTTVLTVADEVIAGPDVLGVAATVASANGIRDNTIDDTATETTSTAAPWASINDISQLETNGNTTIVFTAQLSGPSTEAIVVTASTAVDTADATDFTAATEVLAFAPGETSQTFTVTINGDTNPEPDETFIVNLHSGVNVLIGDGEGVGTILADDSGVFDDTLIMVGESHGETMSVRISKRKIGVRADRDKHKFAAAAIRTVHIVGGAGNDVIKVKSRGAASVVIDGGDGHDMITAGNGADSIDGGAGNDTINGGAGNDWVSGGTGHDLIDGSTGDDSLFGGIGNDTLIGDSGHDLLIGDGGTDVLLGGRGNNVLLGGTGADRLIGDRDSDLLIAGETTYELDNLRLIHAEWTAPRDYATRVSNLLNGIGVPRLSAAETISDAAENIGIGGDQLDLFFVNLNGTTLVDVDPFAPGLEHVFNSPAAA